MTCKKSACPVKVFIFLQKAKNLFFTSKSCWLSFAITVTKLYKLVVFFGCWIRKLCLPCCYLLKRTLIVPYLIPRMW